jgi:hypothetical protein
VLIEIGIGVGIGIGIGIEIGSIGKNLAADPDPDCDFDFDLERVDARIGLSTALAARTGVEGLRRKSGVGGEPRTTRRTNECVGFRQISRGRATGRGCVAPPACAMLGRW